MSILSKTANKQPEASEDHLDTDRLCSTCPSREHCVQVNPACWDVAESYRRLFENAIEGIFRTTPDGHYISVSPSLVKLYGYASANDLTTSLMDINHQLYVEPNRRSEFCRLLDQQGYIQNFESQVYRKDGAIALRIYVRTLIECSIDTLTKAIKLIPTLSHPIFEHKPPSLDFIEVWGVGWQIPQFTPCLGHKFLD